MNKMSARRDSEVLMTAAEVMRQRGHARFYLEDDNMKVCLMGAINVSLYGNARLCDGRTDRMLEHVQKYLNLEYVESPVTWNNQEERTGEEVIQALIGAAEMVSREEEVRDDVDIPLPMIGSLT